MKSIYPCLYFKGNCRAAMGYYKSCLGAALEWQSNIDGKQARLTVESSIILASDIPFGQIFNRGNAASLFVQFHSQEIMVRQFERLVADGILHVPPGPVAGGIMGELTDPFGVRWMFFFPAFSKSGIIL